MGARFEVGSTPRRNDPRTATMGRLMAQGDGGGRIKRKAKPTLRIVGVGEAEVAADPANDTATRLLAPVRPEAPEDLKGDARELFDTLATDLDQAGLLSSVDGPALALAARAYVLAAEAADQVEREGVLSTGSMGQPVAHPGLGAFAQQAKVFGELARGLGLNFAARARITVPEQPADELANPFRGPAAG